MAAERLSMRCVRDVLRLHFENLSSRKIAEGANCKRTTARDYVARLLRSDLKSWEQVCAVSDADLEIALGFKKHQEHGPRLAKFMPDWLEVHRELTKNKNVTLSLLWAEYKELHASGYQYTQFCSHYNLWSKKLSVVMRQNHVAGEKSFVDYCEGICFTNTETGEIIQTQLFVGTLGASSYTFAESTMTQALPDWLMSHVRMFEFFGGVTEITVPDNLKSGVRKPCFYEPVLNESYRDLAGHYKTAIIPAHVRKPRQKAKVECNVLVAQRWILACLRHRTFYSNQEINDAITPLLEKLNHRQMRHVKKSRRELFLELDSPALKPLPPTRYEFSQWKKVKVNIDYHIEYDFHFYSVLYTHVGRELMCRSSESAIELFLSGERIASHRRSYVKGKHTTLDEHMPASHRAMGRFPPSRLIAWGTSIAPSVGQLVEKILSSRRHPEQSYRSAMGVIRLEKKYGKIRLEKTCTRALALCAHSYRFVSDMLKNNTDQLIADHGNKPVTPDIGNKPNVRGRGYYH
jgi:transposase